MGYHLGDRLSVREVTITRRAPRDGGQQACALQAATWVADIAATDRACSPMYPAQPTPARTRRILARIQLLLTTPRRC